MCGIVGIKNLKNKKLSDENMVDLDKAMKTMTHRGPDDSGVCGISFRSHESFSYQTIDELNICSSENEGVDAIFGFNRLSIKDLSYEGHQPMLSDDKKVILIFNGEIYNDRILRDELQKKGCSFSSTSDTEVILKMYLMYGFEKTMQSLNGMFAIAIADLRTNTTYIVRDRFGIKPLYYTIYDNKLFFSSEIKGIIQFREIPRVLDKEAVVTRFSLLRPCANVMLKDVEMLAPGQALIVNSCGDIKYWNYFDVDSYLPDENTLKSEQELLDEMQEIIRDAIERQLVSDVKVGCQLSGGIDSTLVSYYASLIKRGTLRDGFSIVNKGEEHYIDEVGKKCGFKMHKYEVPDEYFFENFERTVWHHESLLHNTGHPSYLKLIEEASKDVTVLMSGEGADETTGGYANFAYGVMQPFMNDLDQNGRFKSYAFYEDYIIRADSYSQKILLVDDVEEVIANVIDDRKAIFKRYHGSSFTKHRKYEITQMLPELLTRQDKISMACSVETRVPLLDNEVVDYVMNVPENMLIRFASSSPFDIGNNPFDWIQGKYIYKELTKQEFGNEFAYRKKTFMTTVSNAESWIASKKFQDYFQSVILEGMKKRDILNWKMVAELYNNLAIINKSQFDILWKVIGFETWCQLFIDGRNYLSK